MKKIILLIIYLLTTILIASDIDPRKHKLTIYPEFVGLGGAPSINIEYNINNYSIRLGAGMIIMQAIIHPIAVYRTYGINEIGLGFNFMDASIGKSIGAGFAYNVKLGNKRVFTRLGILGMYQKGFFGNKNYGFGILPTIGFGINFL
tara:strand:- start:1737 stop:2177 length:441 start_codon:yes stop_codon:yes gene_type:complete